MPSEFESDDERRRREELDFFGELRALATAAEFRPFVIVLMSGTDVLVDQDGLLNIYKTMYTVDRADGSSEQFPRYNVCAIRTLPDPRL